MTSGKMSVVMPAFNESKHIAKKALQELVWIVSPGVVYVHSPRRRRNAQPVITAESRGVSLSVTVRMLNATDYQAGRRFVWAKGDWGPALCSKG